MTGFFSFDFDFFVLFVSDGGILLLASALDVEATFAESSVDALGGGILFSIMVSGVVSSGSGSISSSFCSSGYVKRSSEGTTSSSHDLQR